MSFQLVNKIYLQVKTELPFKGPIGIFDSGYGGLTILRDIRKKLPQYDYLYLGDNARAPYGTRSFDLVYQFTLEAVRHLFGRGCPLIILACNTASAKALRSIQQNNLADIDPSRRVLGVIRPTIENLAGVSHTGHIGLMATPGTVLSGSYAIEVDKHCPGLQVTSQSCPMWVPLVENGEAEGPGADYFVKKYLDDLLTADPDIDTIILGCTHYPLLLDKIKKFVPENILLLTQGSLVADSLADYLRRHPEMEDRIVRGGTCTYLTTEQPEKFSSLAQVFLYNDDTISAERIIL